MLSKNRNRVLAGAISVIALLGISFLVANSSGSGKVSVSSAADKENPALGDFALRLSSGSIEPVEIDLQSNKPATSVFTWKSGEPIRVSYEPPFSEDEEFVGTIMPGELGLNGFSNGRPLFIQVSLEKTSTLLSFRTGSNRPSNEVYAIRLARGNEKAAFAECVSQETAAISSQASAYRELNNDYLASRDRANLTFDDVVSLLTDTWASRAGNLIAYMQADLRDAQASSSLDDSSIQYADSIVSAHQKVMDGWGAIRDAALLGVRRGTSAPQPDWDNAWDLVFAGESALALATSSDAASFARTVCNQIVQ
jgi:hypothetical protein